LHFGVSGAFQSVRAGKISAVTADRRHSIPALDGIRAVAVALVLAEHGGIPGVPGGFLGVDVFFVLSGFLITSMLLVEVREGRVRPLDFWTRLARRLLPALVPVIDSLALCALSRGEASVQVA